MRGRAALGVVAVAAALLAVLARADAPDELAWRAVGVPVGVRLTGVTSGTPLLVAGHGTAGGPAQPRLWQVGPDGRWLEAALAPATYYGGRAALAWVARHGDRVAAIGEAFGGAHGLPRLSTWSGTTSGLGETPQAFELFGGPSAIGVTDLAVGPQAALVVGSWAAGGRPAGVAVWVGDGSTYRRLDVEPGLRSSATDLTTPAAVAARGTGFVVAGTTTHLGEGRIADRATVFWTPGGAAPWHRTTLPSSGDSAARDVACSVSECLVAGVDRGRLALWRLDGEGRARSVRLDAPPVLAEAPAIEVAGEWVAAATTVGRRLWRVTGVAAEPAEPPPAQVLALATTAGQLFALGQDGTLWRTPSR